MLHNRHDRRGTEARQETRGRVTGMTEERQMTGRYEPTSNGKHADERQYQEERRWFE